MRSFKAETQNTNLSNPPSNFPLHATTPLNRVSHDERTLLHRISPVGPPTPSPIAHGTFPDGPSLRQSDAARSRSI
ncbi:hypothetical protein BJX62DRAFT_200199 [Aspergillus germanicus]